MEFVSKWVLDGRTGRKDIELDEIRSEYPVNPASGWKNFSDQAGSGVLLLSVPSQTWFKPRTIIINNETGLTNLVRFYTVGSAGDASASMLCVQVNGSTTNFLGANELKGLIADKDIYVSNLASNVQIRVAGILIQSGP